MRTFYKGKLKVTERFINIQYYNIINKMVKTILINDNNWKGLRRIQEELDEKKVPTMNMVVTILINKYKEAQNENNN